MIYLDLLLGFLRVGCFAFGGAYAAIPLMRDVVMSYGWLTDEAISYMIAVSESTPGPIMINLATYVGSSQGGVLGSLIATLAVAIPSFIIIILIMVIFKNLLKNKYVQAVLSGVKPCIVGIILATGLFMVVNNIIPIATGVFDVRAAAVTAVLAMLMFGTEPVLKKKMSPILLIVISACIGIVVF